MLIDLRKMEDSTVEFDLSFDPLEIDLGTRFSKMLESARFKGRVMKDGWTVQVTGSSKAAIVRKCDRCYKNLNVDVSVSIDSAYVKFDDLNEERETELDIREVDYSVADSDDLNLKEVFEEHLILAIPDQFVCETGCEVICPECGEKKDGAECKCEEKIADPRWAALNEIKKDLD